MTFSMHVGYWVFSELLFQKGSTYAVIKAFDQEFTYAMALLT